MFTYFRTHRRCLPVLVLCLGGCAKPWIARTNYELRKYGSIVVSDSPTLQHQPKRSGNGEVQWDHSIILENLSKSDSYTIKLSSATFVLAENNYPLTCKTFDKREGNVEIAPLQKLRVDCEIKVIANDQNRLKQRDATGQLNIPTNKEVMTFSYFLKVEDFE